MKLKLYGIEVVEVARKFPEFVLDSKEFPELELEMQAVAEADFMWVYDKMYETRVKGSLDNSSEDVMSIVGPFDDAENMIEDYGDTEITFRLSGVDQED